MEDFQAENILDSEYHSEQSPWQGVEYASFWQRAGASLIDTLVMLPLLIGSYFYSGGWEAMMAAAQAGQTVQITLVSFLISLAYPVYKILMEANYGATLGKMAVQLRVVDAEVGSIDLNQSFLRYSIYGIPLILNALIFLTQSLSINMDYILSNIASLAGILTLVSVIFVAIDQRKQALHDMIAKTFVIKNNGRPYGGGFGS